MKKYFYLIFFILNILFFSCTSSKSSKVGYSYKQITSLDTIEQYFFYEANVPNKCFTRFDQIEQSNNIIFFDSTINIKAISELYKKGVFYFTYPSVINNYIHQNKITLSQNKVSIHDFDSSINYFNHQNDSIYTKTLFYDNKNILSYKKIHLKMIVANLGNLQQLIPTTDNYKCCYSNKQITTKFYFIKDILSFEIY